MSNKGRETGIESQPTLEARGGREGERVGGREGGLGRYMHTWMQSRWKTWEQQPKAMERPFSLLGLGLAWYSMDGSFSELRQMAHVSAQMSQLHLQRNKQNRGGYRRGDGGEW